MPVSTKIITANRIKTKWRDSLKGNPCLILEQMCISDKTQICMKICKICQIHGKMGYATNMRLNMQNMQNMWTKMRYAEYALSTLLMMVCTIVKNHKRVGTWYVHGTYIQGYKHVCTLFRRVCTCLYIYIHVLNHINMYIQSLYKHVHARFV